MSTSAAPVTCFLSFADSRMRSALSRIADQARAMNFFDKCCVLDENGLDSDFRKKWECFLQFGVRGYGYWCWKSHIILETLSSLPDDSLLLYCDAGCHLNPQGIGRLKYYFEELKKDPLGIKAFPVYTTFLDAQERRWTKGDVFDFFGCRDNQDITHSNQIAATQILCRKCEAAIALLEEWSKIIETTPLLIDDSPSKSRNLSGYIEHRHDQSLFSILFKLHGGKALPGGETDGILPEEAMNYPIWAKRDRGYKDTRFFARLMRYIKARLFLTKVSIIGVKEKIDAFFSNSR